MAFILITLGEDGQQTGLEGWFEADFVGKDNTAFNGDVLSVLPAEKAILANTTGVGKVSLTLNVLGCVDRYAAGLPL